MEQKVHDENAARHARLATRLSHHYAYLSGKREEIMARINGVTRDDNKIESDHGHGSEGDPVLRKRADEISLQMRTTDEAMLRHEQGVYGKCKDCGDPIEESRLEHVIFAVKCIECKRADEAAERALAVEKTRKSRRKGKRRKDSEF